jgi:hypothetical protein
MRENVPESQPHWVRLGVLFGLLSAAAIALIGPIGVSTTYPRVIGAFLNGLIPGYAKLNPYLAQIGVDLKPETLLVVGLFIGGFAAMRLSGGKPTVEGIHSQERTHGRRYLDAFLGGFFLLFGARLAGGCTSGHIISGISQLAVSGLLFGAGVFATGILTAKLLSRGA